MIAIYITISCIIISTLVVYLTTKDTYIMRYNKGDEFNLKPSYELTQGLSVITLYQGSKGYNFLLDTGSNLSHITSTSSMLYKLTGNAINTYGLSTNSIIGKEALVTLHYNKTKYDIMVNVGTVDAAFDAIKKDTGVSLDGLLGSDFLTKYNKILDYKNLIIHTAK